MTFETPPDPDLMDWNEIPEVNSYWCLGEKVVPPACRDFMIPNRGRRNPTGA